MYAQGYKKKKQVNKHDRLRFSSITVWTEKLVKTMLVDDC